MLIVTKGRYKNQYVVGGAGLFDTITGFFKRLVTSDAAKRAASTMLNAGKVAAKEIGKKAVDLGKEAAVDAGVSSIKPWRNYLLKERAKSLMDRSHLEEQGDLSSTTVTAG